MFQGDVYSKSQIDKLGNAIVYLCRNIPERLTKTHILKLVFILEELAVKKFGIPLFDLNFYVWQLGPVSRDLFVELSPDGAEDGMNFLAEFINKEIQGNTVYVLPKADFNDDEFNDLELGLLKDVVERFKYCTAKELINFTHRKNSPWYNTALKYGILDLLEDRKMSTTEIKIDLSETIQDEKEKLALYNGHRDFLNQSRSMRF